MTLEDNLFHPSQVLCIKSHIQFTQDVEEKLPKAKLNDLREKITNLLYQLASIKRNNESKLSSLKVKAMIVNTIHQRDILANLIQDGTRNVSDWAWAKQLRYYSQDEYVDCKIQIQIGAADYNYAYEYQGTQVRNMLKPGAHVSTN